MGISLSGVTELVNYIKNWKYLALIDNNGDEIKRVELIETDYTLKTDGFTISKKLTGADIGVGKTLVWAILYDVATGGEEKAKVELDFITVKTAQDEITINIEVAVGGG